MESASSLSPSSLKCFLGCWAFGTMRSISISRSCSVESGSDSGVGLPNRALRPRPKAFLCAMMNYLLCQAYVSLSSLGLDVVKQNGLPMARSLSKPNVARYYRSKNLFPKEGLEICHDLVGEIGPLIEHSEQDPLNLQAGVRGLANLIDCLHK